MTDVSTVPGRVAVVTGAGRGIGRAIALRLAEAEATVVLAGRDETALQETGDLLDKTGARWLVSPVDVSDDASVERFAGDVQRRAGVPDIVVCNSGVGGPSAPLWELDRHGWDETFAVNVTGIFLTLRAFLPGMTARGSGSAVLIGSMTGKRPLAHRTPYAASKLALVGLARTVALDAGRFGVRVNVVSPGFVEGERLDWVFDTQAAAQGTTSAQIRRQMLAEMPTGRFVQARDIADAVLFLAGPGSASITGADLNVTGGFVTY